jgi:hypothetical protein
MSEQLIAYLKKYTKEPDTIYDTAFKMIQHIRNVSEKNNHGCTLSKNSKSPLGKKEKHIFDLLCKKYKFNVNTDYKKLIDLSEESKIVLLSEELYDIFYNSTEIEPSSVKKKKKNIENEKNKELESIMNQIRDIDLNYFNQCMDRVAKDCFNNEEVIYSIVNECDPSILTFKRLLYIENSPSFTKIVKKYKDDENFIFNDAELFEKSVKEFACPQYIKKIKKIINNRDDEELNKLRLAKLRILNYIFLQFAKKNSSDSAHLLFDNLALELLNLLRDEMKYKNKDLGYIVLRIFLKTKKAVDRYICISEKFKLDDENDTTYSGHIKELLHYLLK